MNSTGTGKGLADNIIELSKHSIIYGVGVLSRLSSFILLPIHTAYLTQHDYGVMTLMLSFIGVTAVFCSYGLNVSFLRWYVPEEDAEEKARIFSTVYFGIAGVSIIIAILVALFAESFSVLIIDDPSYFNLIYIAAVILLFDALFHLPQLLLQAQKRSLAYVGVVFANVFINLGLSYYLIVIRGFMIEGVLYSAVIASGAAFLLTLPVLLKNIRFHFDFAKYKEFVRYGSPYVANMLFIVLLDLIDRFLLDRFLDAESVALYSANYKLGAAMAVLVNAFRLAWHPFFLSFTESPDAKRTFARVYTYFLFVASGVFLTLSLFVDDIVRIKLGGIHFIAETYWSGTHIIPWILFAYIVMGSYVVFSAGIHIKMKTAYTPMFTGIGLAVNITINLILIPVIGIYGAAIATLLGYLAMTTVQFFTVQKFYHIEYEYVRLAKIMLALLVVFGAYKLFLVGGHPLYKLLLLGAFPAILYSERFFEQAEFREIKRLALRLMGRGKSE